MGTFIGDLPLVGKNTEVDVTSYVAVATAEVDPGTIQWYKDSSNRVSALRYYQAAATVSQGAPLVKDTTSRTAYQMKMSTTAEGGLNACLGIAAHAVSNTGYFGWSFISGYCPVAAINSGYASNQMLRISGTTTGKFGSINLIAATLATSSTAAQHAVIWTLGSESSGAGATDVFTTVSCRILGWLG